MINMELVELDRLPFSEGVLLVVENVSEWSVKGHLVRETEPEKPLVYIWYLKLNNGTWKCSCQNHIYEATWRNWTTCSNPFNREP